MCIYSTKKILNILGHVHVNKLHLLILYCNYFKHFEKTCCVIIIYNYVNIKIHFILAWLLILTNTDQADRSEIKASLW